MEVTVPCPCSGTPHPDGDVVTLRDIPSFRMGANALGWASQPTSQPASADISEMFIREGITAWTFLEDDGSTKPVTDETLDWFLDDYTRAYPVAEVAAGLYADVIFAPLQAQVRSSSPTSRTGRSTSARSPRSRSRQSPS